MFRIMLADDHLTMRMGLRVLPTQSGVAVASALHQRDHPARVLAFSAYDDKHYVRGMMAAGA